MKYLMTVAGELSGADDKRARDAIAAGDAFATGYVLDQMRAVPGEKWSVQFTEDDGTSLWQGGELERPEPSTLEEQAKVPGVYVIDKRPWHAVVRDGETVITVLAATPDGLVQYDSAEELQAANPPEAGAEITRLRAQLTEATAAEADFEAIRAERDSLATSARMLAQVLSSKLRELYAVWIDLARDQPGLAIATVTEALDGSDDLPEWDGKETGVQWLERTWEPGGGNKAETMQGGGQ